jgi:hypothetical protein
MAALFAVAFSSCKELKLVGELNMVSTRNVENVDYVLIKNYEGLSKRQIKKSRAENLNQAIDQTVQNTPGGEFLKNVKVYMIEGTFKTFYAVQGDVWGAKNSTISHMGFKVGDRVQWKVTGNTKSGKITNLKDGTQATIQEDDSQNFVNVEYKKLTIIQKSE